jgi:hypothetical protein
VSPHRIDGVSWRQRTAGLGGIVRRRRHRRRGDRLDERIPDTVADRGALLSAIAGHVVTRGVLTRTYER